MMGNNKNKAAVLVTKRFDNIDSAAIITRVCKAVLYLQMTKKVNNTDLMLAQVAHKCHTV